MTQEEPTSATSQTSRSWLRRRSVICVIGILAIVIVVALGPMTLSLWARKMASREMDDWALSSAQDWLARAASLDPGNGTADLMKAVCHRRLDQMEDWHEAILVAEKKGVSAELVLRETKLGLVRTGQFHKVGELRMDDLLETGASMHDVAATFVHGYLLTRERNKAGTLLDSWETIYPNEAHVAYMRGVYRYDLGESIQAMAEFEDALTKQPRHEPARKAIAELCETGDQLRRAFEHFGEFTARSPENAVARVGLARVSRKQGGVDIARVALGELASQVDPPAIVAMEMGQIELESGNYDEAKRWYGQANLDQLDDPETLASAATAYAFTGQATRSEDLFTRSTAMMSASTRIYDLEVSLIIDPSDRQAADELQRLAGGSRPMSADAPDKDTTTPPLDTSISALEPDAGLYAQHCGACHGVNGDGDGRAAWHLFPRPRDFRNERFRLVSTLNGVPSLDDLVAVTELGMPGTSMPAFESLNEQQHKVVAQEVLRLHRESVRSRFVDLLQSEGEEIDEDEVRQVVEAGTTAGEVLSVPQIGPLNSQSVAKGRQAYNELGCVKCHGDDGIGSAETPSYDDNGRPVRPRDLAHEPFRGGHEPESIYRRIALGMPGSPHPASPTLTEDDVIGLVHFCQSLSQEPKRTLTNHQRAILASGRAYLSAFGASPASEGED